MTFEDDLMLRMYFLFLFQIYEHLKEDYPNFEDSPLWNYVFDTCSWGGEEDDDSDS